MKILGKVILFLIIIVPIIICCVTLNKIWSEEEVYDDVNGELGDNTLVSGDEGTVNDVSGDDIGNEIEIVSGEMAGEQYESKIGEPISKLYTDATVNITVANVYAEADETSEIVGTLEKFTVINAHKYPQGWTRVADGTISGWMRTDNISFPEGGMLGTGDDAKTGVITAEPYLNMRASASTSAEIITTIPKGETITIKDSTEGWYKVTYASATGWISADYVSLNQ